MLRVHIPTTQLNSNITTSFATVSAIRNETQKKRKNTRTSPSNVALTGTAGRDVMRTVGCVFVVFNTEEETKQACIDIQHFPWPVR